MLEAVFKNLCAAYSGDTALIHHQWNEIATAYGQQQRYYHNLTHLQHLCNSLLPLENAFTHWNETMFCLFYHDVVYNTLKNDNEEQSALRAREAMTALGVSSAMIDFTCEQILCTKNHSLHQEADINYFTDADLAILGEEWLVYKAYALHVRKEYSMYPDLLYKPGRKKVLQRFLLMNRIYKTDFFYCKLERTARNNIEKEILGLNN